MSTPPTATASSRDATLLGDDVEPAGASPTGLERGTRVARYLLLDVVGEGSMGRVYAAYDPDLDRRIALKLMARRSADDDHRRRDRFLREAQAMARIDHPNVIPVYDAGTHEGWVWLAMALVDGPSLAAWLVRDRTRREILDVFIGAGRGLDAAHRAGVVHGDFKPANVLVGADGVARVGDFGLAGVDEPTTGDERRPGHAIGTPAYMSPEHIAGAGVDARSDQFSFCVALSEALLAERPFVADSLPVLATKILQGALSPRIADARGRLGRVLRRGLSSSPEDRFASMAELVAELDRMRRGSWRQWGVLGTVAAAVGASVVLGVSPSECGGAEARVGSFWDGSGAGIGGASYTDAFIEQARARYVTAVDAYASSWKRAYETSCGRVGRSRDDGTLEERRAAECLENRLASLRGLVELVGDRTVDAANVDALVGSLPSLAECDGSAWTPYPADPEAAARASELHRRLERLEWARYADAGVGRLGEARDVERAAQEVGEPYLWAIALRELGRLESDAGETEVAAAHFDHGLRLALESGNDRVAATVVNEMLISANRSPTPTREALRISGVGLALAVRSGAEDVAGSLMLNKSNLLRKLDEPDAALEALRDAGDFYRRAGSEQHLWRVRVSEVTVLIARGDVDAALRKAQRLRDESSGDLSSALELVHIDRALWSALNAAGRYSESLEVARAALARAREVFVVDSRTLHDAAWSNAAAAIRVGNVEEAEACLQLLAEPTVQEIPLRAGLRAWTAMTAGRMEEAARILDDALQAPERTASTHLVEIERSYLYLLDAEVAEAKRILERPQVWPDAAKSTDSAIDFAIGAMLAGVAAPEGKTWAEVLESLESPLAGTQQMRAAALGMARGSVPEVSAIRAQIASDTTERAPELRLFDLWLARQGSGSAP